MLRRMPGETYEAHLIRLLTRLEAEIHSEVDAAMIRLNAILRRVGQACARVRERQDTSELEDLCEALARHRQF